MLETITLITLSLILMSILRPGKTPPLDNPLVIERPGHYHMTLAPLLNLAQPFIEALAGRIGSSHDPAQYSATQYFEVRDNQVTAHGHDCYLLAATQRNGIMFFQAASPSGGDQNSRRKIIGEFAEAVLVPSMDGAMIPLGQLAKVSISKGAPAIRTENALLSAYIFVDIRERDIGSYVADARRAVSDQVKFPPGYYATWSGQFEYMERAAAKMKIVIPITLLIIFLLLYLNFKRVTESLVVMLSVPFALVGGVWLLWLLDYNLSVAVAVGFIALAGVAAETGVVMLIYLEHAWQEVQARCTDQGRQPTTSDLHAAIMHGAVERVRPKMMTVVAIMAGLLPILWSSGTGSEVMRRIAAPMVGGMISSAALTLLVIPAIYALIKTRALKR